MDPILIDLLLDGKYYSKKKKSKELDLFKMDKNNENVLHYLFSKNEFEYDTVEIFEKIMIYAENNIKNKNKINLLTKEDKKGKTPLVIILKKGWYNVLETYITYFEYMPHIIKPHLSDGRDAVQAVRASERSPDIS